MNRSNFALFVAVLIHLLLLTLFLLVTSTLIDEKKVNKKPHERKIKISLKELPKKHKKSGLTKKKIQNPKIAPPMPKGSQLKKIIQQKNIMYKESNPRKEPKLNKAKKQTQNKEPKKFKKIKALPKKRALLPLLSKNNDINKTKKAQKNKALSWLYQDVAQKENKEKKKKVVSNSNISQDIKELYGEKFGKLSPGQQQYILDNQEIMRRITQQVLNRVARVNIPRDLRVNTSNVIEFYLHPNGDMTDFKFLSKSGYYVLDDTTKETIEYAYSRYPRPKEKTLIRYNVFYHLAY
ncbi:hypothetical protein [Sulfurimonas sp.]